MGIVLTTGIVGTPIHELSHAIMCIPFLHHIEEIKFFQIGDEDGVLGYVKHSYNPRNLWSRLGNFFIGIAPIFGGAAIIFVLYRFITPDLYYTLKIEFDSMLHLDFNIASGAFYQDIFNIIGNVYKDLFNASNFANGLFYIPFILSLFIAMHMIISVADIKGSLSGLLFTLIGLLILDIAAFYTFGINNVSTVVFQIILLVLPVLTISLGVNLSLTIISIPLNLNR